MFHVVIHGTGHADEYLDRGLLQRTVRVMAQDALSGLVKVLDIEFIYEEEEGGEEYADSRSNRPESQGTEGGEPTVQAA